MPIEMKDTITGASIFVPTEEDKLALEKQKQAISGYEELKTKVDNIASQTLTYPIIEGEIGVVDKTFPYGDVKRYGALGNGTNSSFRDDSPFIQNCIDSSYAIGVSVDFSKGQYVIKNPLELPKNIKISSSSAKIAKRGELVGTSLNCYTKELFISKDKVDKKIRADISNLFMYNRGSDNYICFSGIEFYSTLITNCDIHNFGYVFTSKFNSTSRFSNNNVQLVNFSLFSRDVIGLTGVQPPIQGIVDAYITDNYISGNNTRLPVAFNRIDFATSCVSKNYFDFFFSGVLMSTGGYTTFSENTFDYIYKPIDGTVAGATFTSNLFFHISKNYASSFTNATSEMKNNEWSCFNTSSVSTDPSYVSMNRVNVTGNTTKSIDKFAVIRGINKYNINFSGNLHIDHVEPSVLIEYNVGLTNPPVEGEQKAIMISELMDLEVTTLPNPTLTGSNIVSFNGQTLVYKNKKVVNRNGVWLDALGSVVV